MMNIKKLLFTVSVSTLCFTALAETDVNAVDNLNAEQPKAVASVSLPKIAGFINARFQNTSGGFVAGKNGFDIKNAIVDMTGTYGQSFNYRLRVDFAVAPQVLDAYVEWKPLKSLGVQFGQFQLPYTFENQYVPKTLESAELSQVIGGLVATTSGVKNKGRDIGLAINGNFFAQKGYNLIDYKLAFLNGNTFNANDDNSTIDVLASLYLTPIKPLSFNAAYETGKYGAQAVKLDKSRMAFGAKYDDGKALVRAEYVAGETSGIKADGYYAVAGYFVGKSFQPIVKYDYYRSNKAIETAANTQYVVGLNYWMANKSRFLVNYIYNKPKNTTINSTGTITAGFIMAF